jgi:hypothetical protein
MIMKKRLFVLFLTALLALGVVTPVMAQDGDAPPEPTEEVTPVEDSADDSEGMEYIDSILALFPAVAVTAILIRYLIEAAKKFEIEFIAKYPGRAQAVLNALAWLGMGLAAHFGVDGQVLEVIRRLTDAWPGLMGLLDLIVPAFLGILATKAAHEALKTTESKETPAEEPPTQIATATSEVSPQGDQKMTLQVGNVPEVPVTAVVDTMQYGTGTIDPKS